MITSTLESVPGKTITEHLDIESMIFLCERLVALLDERAG